MRYLCASLLVLAGLAPALADDAAALKEARQRWLRGNYGEARTRYQNILKKNKNDVVAVIGLSRTWESQGQYDQALARVETALKAAPKSADLLARQAELLYVRGRWDDAQKAADAALKIDKDHFLAHWMRGQVYRDKGDLRKADADFRWLVRAYDPDKLKDPEKLVIVGQAATENARWHSLSDQFDDILKDIYGDAIKLDKDYWPAEYHAGMLLLEKENGSESFEALQNAETINASAAEVLVGRGVAALEKMETKEAENFARRALDINPRLTSALRLHADVYLAAGELKKALELLKHARAVNPREEETLARMAACHYLLHGKGKLDKDFQALVKEVEKYDTKPGVFYAQLAERLEERRHFDDAKAYYKESLKHWPMLPTPHANLGLLYMRMGDEKEGRTTLEQALKVNEFNKRVSNMLKVLKHLEKYDKLETRHFLIRFDPKNDKVLARFLAKYLEETYDSLAKQFNYSPKGPILFELFNRHDMFSGRTIALPDLHTIGACTGRMVTMVSPRDQLKVVRKPFNWARVVHHELVHIFNLKQTNFLVPHWFTEGLAVMNEGFPRPPSWNRLLLRRLASKTLLNLDNINMGFIHPRSAEEWSLAYLQSLLYVQLIKTYGDDSLGIMLDSFGKGLGTEAALKKACKGISKAAFEKRYRTYIEDIARKLTPARSGKSLTFAQLEKAHKARPEDPGIAAQLAEQYLEMDEKDKARKLAEAALKSKEAHPLASYVRARLLLDGGDKDRALKLLEAARKEKQPGPKVLGLLGEMYFDAEKYVKAAGVYEEARKADPYESRWLIKLAQVYGRSDKTDKLIGILEKLAPLDADDLAVRKRLADLLLKAGKFAEAEKYARAALEIDVLDSKAQRALKEALKKQKDKDKALQELEKLLAK